MRRVLLGVLLAGLTVLLPLLLADGAAWADGQGKAAKSDWPTVGGGDDNAHYSPLKQIDKANVAKLGAAWLTKLEGDKSRATPVVVDGTLYVSTTTQVVAVDARTGAVRWKYKPEPSPFGFYRGVGVADGLVYVGLSDARLLALDAKTGAVVWDRLVGDEKPADMKTMGNQWITGAPVIANGVVIVGLSGARSPADRNDGRVVGVDAKTGAIKWLFHVVPGPGEPGHETWPQDNDSWKKGGGALWVTPAIDRELGLVFIGTGNAIPELGGDDRAGDNLYTASMLALDIKTGKLRWHYQLTHHDVFEHDLGTPPLLYTARVKGKTVKGVAIMRTDGWMFLLDRKTGKPLIPVEERPVPQNAQQKTAPTQPFPQGEQIGPNCIEPGRVPDGFTLGCYFDALDAKKPSLVTPTITTRSSPIAYAPESQRFFVAAGAPIVWMRRWDDARIFTAVSSMPYAKGFGILAALDATTNKIAWQKRVPRPVQDGSGFTVTAAGLLFHGEPDGNLQALDAATGETLWQFQTGFDALGPAAVYELDGEQYVSVISGSALWGFKLGGTVAPLDPPVPPPLESSFAGRLVSTDKIATTGGGVDQRSMRYTIEYHDEYSFQPVRAKVKAGASVTFTNDGKERHGAVALDGSWRTPELAPGQSATVKFDRPGEYVYRCPDHPWSYAQIIVE